MCASPFQKRHKRRKAHDGHNVTSDTAIVVGTSFMYLCGTDKSVLSIFLLFISLWTAGNAAGCRTRQARICICDYSRLFVFPVPKPSFPAFAGQGNGGQDRLKTNAAGGTPATASHASMTMTARDFRHGGRKAVLSPCPLRRPLIFPVAHRAIPHSLFPFPFRLSKRMPMFPCRHSRRHQWSFSLLGQR